MAFRRKNEQKEPKRKPWEPKLQMEIRQLKDAGENDAAVLRKLQLDGHKEVLREIKWYTDRHNYLGERHFERR